MRLAHITRPWKRRIVLLLGAAMLPLLGACGAAPTPPATATPLAPIATPAPGGAPTAYPAPAASPIPAAQATPATPAASVARDRPTLPRVAPTGALPPLTGLGEVPADKAAAAIADLARRTGADPSAITIVSAEAVTWNDGALGCPRPGMAYTQALVDGYRLILSLNGVNYAYHAAVNGDFFYCERPGA
ncbi:MAG: hypothetical protein N2378_16795 [Chloroflexaceae bacterium]|nr:hypothetical protein [Chloroflexaceae bacterium]